MMHARTISTALLALATLTACSADVITSTSVITPSASNAAASPGDAVVVTEADISRQAEDTPPLRPWVLYVRNAGNGAFRSGPATPPLGVGSFELVTPTGADKATLFNFEQINTPLSDIRSMSYSTYRTSGSAQQVAALNIQVDINGAAPGGFTTLVFEPVYNTSQGAVVSGQWQDWNAYDGGNAIWWSSNPIPSTPNRDTFVPWSTIVAANPDAVVVGGFGVNQGSGNPGLVTAVDALHFDTTHGSVTWNFEPFRTPTSKNDCKNGGWQTLKRADGSSFKNQGDCVSYTNH
jgi:hypothetical protein